MAIPHVRPFSGNLPRRPYDERDPRAYDVFKPWEGDKLPSYGLLGLPFDGAVLGRKGCAQGPGAIREAFRYDTSYNVEDDVQIHGTSCADLGDVDLPSSDVTKAHERATEAIGYVFQNGGHPLILGGDNSLTYAAMKALAQSGAKRIGIFDLDAHLDVRVPDPDINSGCPYYLILENIPEVKPQNLVQMGLRRFTNSRGYLEWAIKKGVRLYAMKEIRRRGFQSLVESAVKQAVDGVDALYVSLDMDVVDQAWAPGVSSPSPDGLTPREVFDAVQVAGAQPMARGFEVMEVAPNLDPTGNTARVAATAVLQYLVGRIKPASAQRAVPPQAQRAPPPRTDRRPEGGRSGGYGGYGGGPPRGPRPFGRGPPRGGRF